MKKEKLKLHMNTGIKKVFGVISTVLVVVVVIFAVLLVGVRLIGLQVFTVLSGSMEPAYDNSVAEKIPETIAIRRKIWYTI